MNDSIKAFWLGVFIIVALALTTWLVLFLKPSVGDKKAQLTVRFSNIDKVTQGTLVTFGGRQVGEVKKIKEVADPRNAPADSLGNLYIYELLLQVDSSVKVYLYDEIIYASAGLLGEKSIAIVPKAPPAGAPPAYEVTHEILYARSTDRLEQTLQKFSGVADTLQEALEEVNTFIATNNEDFNTTLKSVNLAAKDFSTFMVSTSESDIANKTALAMTRAVDFFTSIRESQVFDRVTGGFESLNLAASKFTTGEGTLARLANSDCLYVQLNATLCQLRTVLSDLANFGILYQFDRKWQRLSRMRRHCTQIPCTGYCQP